MPNYDYECEKCHNVREFSVHYDDRTRPRQCECGGAMTYTFPVDALRGFMPFEPYYDEALDLTITGRRAKREVLSAMGLREVGDTVHGGRNFDAKAPHHVKPLPPRWDRTLSAWDKERRDTEAAKDWMIGIEDKDGRVRSARISDLPSAGEGTNIHGKGRVTENTRMVN